MFISGFPPARPPVPSWDSHDQLWIATKPGRQTPSESACLSPVPRRPPGAPPPDQQMSISSCNQASPKRVCCNQGPGSPKRICCYQRRNGRPSTHRLSCHFFHLRLTHVSERAIVNSLHHEHLLADHKATLLAEPNCSTWNNWCQHRAKISSPCFLFSAHSIFGRSICVLAPGSIESKPTNSPRARIAFWSHASPKGHRWLTNYTNKTPPPPPNHSKKR